MGFNLRVGMISLLIACFYLNFVISSKISLLPSKRLECTEKTCNFDESKLRFMIIGDTGGLPIFPYFTYAQSRTAFAMNVVAKQGADFIINLGDNFYFNGVRNIFDDRFKNSFENIYSYDSLNIPWYIIAGNHDHLGNITVQQIYTQSSSKWTFPERLFYKLSYGITSENGRITTVDILLIDTIVLCGNTVDIEGKSVLNWLFARKRQPTAPPLEYKELAEEQWIWIDETLSNSKANYIFVAGHYPIHSASEHGSFECLEQKLDPMLRQYRVNAYFAGHDHNLQHIQLNKTLSNGEISVMNYIVCGAGSRTDSSVKHAFKFKPEELKFMYPTSWNPFSQMGFSKGGFINSTISHEEAIFDFMNSELKSKYQLRLKSRI